MAHSEMRSERYVEVAVRAELDELASASSGRNAALNKAAFVLGGFVAAGALREDDAIDGLIEACEANGYARKDGRSSVQATIKSGLRKGMQSPRPLPRRDTESLPERATLAAFAAARKLPPEVLTFYGWRDGEHGIEIPYSTRNGEGGRTRIRGAMTGERRFWWAKSDVRPIVAYEPDSASTASDLIICEGESDTVTLAYGGFRALGVPGADLVRVILPEHLEGVARVFVAADTNPVGDLDSGAAKFVPGVRKRLADIGFKGSMHELRMADQAKDASALFVRNPETFASKLYEAMRLAIEGPKPAYRVLSEMVAECLRPLGRRFVTGFATLDEATRGGVPVGRLVGLAGAPGAGKSGVATQLADQLEQQGCVVVYLAADEPAEGIVTRLGQRAGFSREGLESEGEASDAVRAGFAKQCEGRALAVIDPDADESMSTIEDAAGALEHLAGNRPRVLIVDSLQTARCRAADAAENAREKMDAKVSTLKAIAKRGALVVFITEMARSGYRTGDRNTDVSALAASKESGSIEYAASLLLGLRSTKGEHGQLDVEVAKNRLGGSKPEFRLQLDFERATFSEIELPSEGARTETKRASNLGKVEEDARTLYRLLVHRPGLGERDLRAAVRSAGHTWGRDRLDAAKAKLAVGVDGHRLVNRGNNRGSCWFVELVGDGGEW